MSEAIRGILPIVYTPFDADGRVDEEDLERLVDYMVEQHFIARAMPIEDLFVPIPDALGT